MPSRRHGKRRKFLCVSEDEFFTAVLLQYGKPDPQARNYMYKVPGKSTWPTYYTGVGAYLHYHERGKLFTQLLLTFGEAKARASKFYYRYCQWCKKHGVIPQLFELEFKP